MSYAGQRHRSLALLGLEPGARADEIKSAYRDMAKVWHPDRFAHDPRLQQKAQEKLKEINDAYRQLLADPDRTRRATDDASREATYHAERARHERRDTARSTDDHARATRDGDTRSTRAGDTTSGARRHDAITITRDRGARRKTFLLALAPVVIFCATFALVTPRLLSSRAGAPLHVDESTPATQQSRDAQAADAVREQRGEDARQPSARTQRQTEGAARAELSAVPEGIERAAAAPVRALATVSVSIDPATNLLARADCPHRLSVTYPAGEEPRAYCNADHRRADANTAAMNEEKRADKSRLKSLVGRLASPSKWFTDKSSAGEPAKKSAPRVQGREQD